MMIILSQFQVKLNIILIETIFIGFLAIFFLNSAAYLFSMSAEIPQRNRGLLERLWLEYIRHVRVSTAVL